jgi:hypothetical protein
MDDVIREWGPEDVNGPGDLAGKSGTKSHAKRLIEANAAAHPPALVAAQNLPEDTDRTRFLDPDEVLDTARDTFDNVGAVRSARVRGKGRPEEELVVVLLLEDAKSGRNYRAKVPYTDFSSSTKAFRKARKEGAISEGPEDAEGKQQRIEALERENDRIRQQLDAAQGVEEAKDDAPYEGYEEDTTAKDVIAKVNSGDLSAEQLDALEQAEKNRSPQRKSALKAIKSAKSG